MNKWEQARADEIASVGRAVGKTIDAIYSSGSTLTIRFTDDSTLEIGCAVVQTPMSDVAELQFDFEDGNG